MTYREFLETKMVIAPESGFDVEPAEVNPRLLPHQRDAVESPILKCRVDGPFVLRRVVDVDLFEFIR